MNVAFLDQEEHAGVMTVTPHRHSSQKCQYKNEYGLDAKCAHYAPHTGEHQPVNVFTQHHQSHTAINFLDMVQCEQCGHKH